MGTVREAEKKKQRPGKRGASHAPGRAWCGKSWRVVVVADPAAPPPATDRARRLLASLIADRLLAQAEGAPPASAPATAPALATLQGGE